MESKKCSMCMKQLDKNEFTCKDCSEKCKKIEKTGTFILSYLCKAGIIKSKYKSHNGYVEGKLKKDFFGLNKGLYIMLEIDVQGSKDIIDENLFKICWVSKINYKIIKNLIKHNSLLQWFEYNEEYGVYKKYIKLNLEIKVVDV